MKIHLGIIGIAMLEPIGGCTTEMERPKNQPKHAFYIYKYIIYIQKYIYIDIFFIYIDFLYIGWILYPIFMTWL